MTTPRTAKACAIEGCLEYSRTADSAHCPTHRYPTRRQAARAGTNAQQRMRRRVQANTTGICAACSQRFPAELIQIDHIRPLHRHGTDTDDNVQPLCKPCHTDKSNDERATDPGRATTPWT